MSTKTVRISKEYLEVVKLWGDYYQISDSQVIRMFIRIGMMFIEKETGIAHVTPKFKQLSEERELLKELFDEANAMLSSSRSKETTATEFDGMLAELAALSK